jgi:hypothetical protein
MEKQIQLTPRDQLIFEQLAQFEISTKKILHSSFFEGRRMKAVDSTIRRLDARGIGYVNGRRQPNSRTQYFELTKAGAEYLGTKVNKQPMAISRLFTLIGRLHFINRPPEERQRALCTDAMLAKFIACEAFKSGKIRPPRVDFYIAQNKIVTAEDRELALGAILPDLNASVDRVAKRCIKHSMSFVERGWFIEVMRAGRFEWTILTGHQAKEEELRQATTRMLQRRMASLYFENSLDLIDVPPIRVKVEVIPELANLRLLKKKKKKAIRDSSQPVPRSRKNN